MEYSSSGIKWEKDVKVYDETMDKSKSKLNYWNTVLLESSEKKIWKFMMRQWIRIKLN